jgi:hypothetical protein|tara:strand:+ start:182 stop:430 length:249 start_codon:yes stop_codon:yes gene_type:complete
MNINDLPFKQYDVWKRPHATMIYKLEIDLIKNNFVTYTITANLVETNMEYKETKLEPLEKFIDIFNEKIQKEDNWILVQRKL